jgi:hypothetical protein
VIGSSLFALATVPGFAPFAGAGAGAAWVQLVRSRAGSRAD